MSKIIGESSDSTKLLYLLEYILFISNLLNSLELITILLEILLMLVSLLKWQ